MAVEALRRLRILKMSTMTGREAHRCCRSLLIHWDMLPEPHPFGAGSGSGGALLTPMTDCNHHFA